MNDKNKLLLIIIGILGIILIGVGIGYSIYKIQDNSYQKIEENKQMDKDNKEGKTEDEDNETDQNDNIIDAEFSIELVQVDEYFEGVKINNQIIFEGHGVAYEVIDDLVVAYETDGTSDIQNMAIFDKKGDVVFNPEGELENGLLLTDVEIDKEGKIVKLYSSVDEESGAKSENIYNTTGKDSLYDLTCSELEYYKDKLVAMETYELIINGDSFKLNSVDKKYLKDYVKYDFNHYGDLVNNCQN